MTRMPQGRVAALSAGALIFAVGCGSSAFDSELRLDASPLEDVAEPVPDVPATGPETQGPDQRADDTRPGPDLADAPLADLAPPEGDSRAVVDTAVDIADAPAAIDAAAGELGSEASLAVLCTGSYDACGCGCCAGGPRKTACYYPSLGQTTTQLSAEDSAVRSGTNCALVGCSAGVRYVCCAEASAASPGSATYAIERQPPEGPSVEIRKTGAECATLRFVFDTAGTAQNPAFAITSKSKWVMVGGEAGTCGEAGARDALLGAIGTLDVWVAGTMCMNEGFILHATAFVVTADGTVKSIRFDADNLVTRLRGDTICGP